MTKTLWLTLGFLAAFGPAYAQVETGTIVGTVVDASGGTVPNASVRFQSLATEIVTAGRTNEAGRYQSPPLKPAEYDVSVEHAGFRRAVTRVRVEVNQRIAVDFQLQVGDTAESISVSAVAQSLETESSTLGNVRTERAVAELPLNARNFAFLITLSAGTVPSFNYDSGSLPGTTRRGVSNASVNGVRSTNDWNSILIEGVDNTENHNGFGVVVVPPVDAIQEFKIQTNSADAQFGRAAGGITNLVLKSGGRALHGSLYEFHRNSEFDARNYFTRPADNTHFVLNQFGGTLGGPVTLPRLYNRNRDRTFFFVSTQWDRRRQALAQVSTVPTARMRVGDFSEHPNRIYDPLTTSGNRRDLFPGNVVPTNRFNPVGRRLVELYPLPNGPGVVNNYVSTPTRDYNGHQTDFKLDHYLTQSHTLTFRGSLGDTTIVDGPTLPLPAAASIGPTQQPARQFSLIDRITLSPNKLNEFRFGFTRFNLRLLQPNAGQNLAQELGIPGVNTGDDLTSGLPRLTITGFQVLGDDPFNPGVLVTNNFQTEDNFFYTAGTHSLRFGTRIDRRQYNAFQTSAVRGVMNFTGAYTNNPAGAAGTGIGLADLLLGAPANGNINILDGVRGFRRTELGFYLQDDWKATRRLSVNLGLRYELYPNYPWVEVADRGAQFVAETASLVRVGTNGVSRTAVRPDRNNFAPRVGLAYRLNDRTVLRSAFGIFYAAPQYEVSRNLAVNPPFAGAFTFTNNQLDFTGARRVDQGFDRTFSALGAGLNAIDPNLRLPYVQQWNSNVQRQLPFGTVLTLAYVGTKGVKLRDQVDINQPRPGPGAVAARRPFPQFQGIQSTEFRANSTYHSLQATFEKRYSSGLSFLTSYTWAHAIDDADVFGGGHQDMLNLRADRGNAPFDLRHNLVFSYNYELPSARSGPAWGRALLAGWQTNGILRLASGIPFTPTVAANSLNGSGFQRPNVAAGCDPKLDDPTPLRWFDTACFVAPPQFTFGNAGRNIVVGPGTRQLDLSVFRNVALSRSADRPVSLQLRGEAFNVTNTPQFNLPNSSIGSASAGVISAAGAPSSFQRTQRQIQVAAKVLF